MCCLVTQSALCNPTDCGPPGSSVHGLLQTRILEWVAMPSSRGSSPPRDWTQVSHTTGGFFTIWATREPLRTKAQNVNYTSLSGALTSSYQQPWMPTVPGLPEAVASKHHWTSTSWEGREKETNPHTPEVSFMCSYQVIDFNSMGKKKWNPSSRKSEELFPSAIYNTDLFLKWNNVYVTIG